MIWRIRIGLFLVGSVVVWALVWFDLSAWWMPLLVGLACAATDGACVERFVRGPKVTQGIMYLLSEYGELPGDHLRGAVRGTFGAGPTRRYFEMLETAKLIASRPYPTDPPGARRRLYAITAAGRAAMWSNAQEGEG